MIRYLEKKEVIQKGDKVWFAVADDGAFYDVNPDTIGKEYDGKLQMIREAELN